LKRLSQACPLEISVSVIQQVSSSANYLPQVSPEIIAKAVLDLLQTLS